MISDKAYALTAEGELVELGDPRGVVIFCGEGSTLEGERAAKLQAHYDAVAAEEATREAADKAAADKVAADAKANAAADAQGK